MVSNPEISCESVISLPKVDEIDQIMEEEKELK